MKINRVRQNVFPMLAALIWGTAFVAQSVGADYVELSPGPAPGGI